MKTEYGHIRFVPTILKGVWSCKNNSDGTVLGTVSYYGHWKRYVFECEEGMVFDKSRLADIRHFIGQLR